MHPAGVLILTRLRAKTLFPPLVQAAVDGCEA
jgi:hypothetical protein